MAFANADAPTAVLEVIFCPQMPFSKGAGKTAILVNVTPRQV